MSSGSAARREGTAGFEGSNRSAHDGMALVQLLVADTGKRVRLFSGIGIGVFAAGTLLAVAVPSSLGQSGGTSVVMTALCVVLLAFSIVVHVLARREDASPGALMRLGLAYVVLTAGAMAAAETVISAERVPEWDGVSGICVWIVLFPLIIPCLPRQALVTSLLSASMLPLLYFVQLPFDGTRVATATLVRWWGPVYFCAGLSFAAALSVHRLTVALAAARSAVRGTGRYELVEQLSEGGMGQIWRARHRFLPHDVVVKLVRPTAVGEASQSSIEELARRFRSEAHAVAQLRSPNTVKLFDYGVDDDGELFSVMEHLTGLDLQTLVERFGPLPASRVIHVLDQIGRSLEEAHDTGLVHRDVKPANLMICRLGGHSDVVKVLDFGLVSPLAQPSGSDSNDEREPTVSGTPGYIAPEVLRGARADARSDLYALGVVAYWLLTGTTLFPREDGREEIGRHLSDAPEDPAARRGEPLPRDLTDIVLRLVAKSPEARPQSAGALRHELRACAAFGEWTDDDADRWWLAHGDR